MKTLNAKNENFNNDPKVVLQKVKLSDGSTILFEAVSSDSNSNSLKEVSNKGIPSLEDITSKIKTFTKDLQSVFNEVKPDKVSVKFGVEMSIESGEVLSLIVKGSGKSNLEITLEWNSKA